jgi:hypothetical protein
MEKWKDIKGYEGYYQVSNLGNVKSLDRVVWNGKVFHKRIGKILKPKGDRYYELCLTKQGKLKKVYIHRLVAQAFIPNPNNKAEVNHMDGNKVNNHISNLEWCTSKENKKHAWENGYYTK